MMIRITINCFFLVILNFIVQVNSQTCNSTIPYSRCSINSACGCFPMIGTNNIGVCGFLWKTCSQLVPCGLSHECSDPDHICLHHSRCSNDPLCYPVSMIHENICPTISTVTNTTNTTTIPMEVTTTKIKWNKWKQEGNTVAGGNGTGNELNQLHNPIGIVVDKDKNIFIADNVNHRIMKWKSNETEGTIVAGGNGRGDRLNQLNGPLNVVVDEQNNSLIISDQDNRRVIRWFNENQQEILIENIDCNGLAIDKYGFVYVSDPKNSQVKRWKIGEKGAGTIVAGGNGKGYRLNQFSYPTFLFVDDEQSIYVSDWSNYRVMKWRKDAKEGVIVAGGNEKGNNLDQLNYPQGLFVDDYGQIYVVDYMNHRIMRWKEGVKEGEIIVGGNGEGQGDNQVSFPIGLSFDLEGNLYVSDRANHRIQKFDLIF